MNFLPINVNNADKMFFIVTLFLLLMSGTRAQQGSSSMGTHFVAAFPKTSLVFSSVSMYATTYEMKAALTLYKSDKVESKSPKWKMEKFTVTRHGEFKYKLTTQDCLDSNKVYNALVLKSNVAIKAFVRWVDYEKKSDNTYGNADIYDLVPKDICHTSYYIATTIGSPFILILTFDEVALIHVAFPNLRKRFSLACAGDKPCAPGKNVSFSMEKYKAWYFLVRDKPNTKYDLHNTYITSDKPIFVISGNMLCQMYKGSLLQDMCISSPKPMYTWGKEYVAPFFDNKEVTVLLRFSSATYPFKSKITFLKTSRELSVRDEFYVIEFKVKAPFIISSNTACAVTYYFSLSDGKGAVFSYSAQSLFPTAQWTQGSVRVIALQNYYETSNVIFIVSTVKKIIKEIGTKETISMQPLRANNHTYYYGWSKDKGQFSFNVRGKDRLMVYILHVPLYYTAATRNLDYFHGVINDPTCKKTKPVPSDGVDNDCDGKLDEEAENGKDDDGDGLVDEDTIRSSVKESTWSPWETCRLKCDGKDITLKYRSCEVGMYTGSCKGENQKCDPGPACPTKCVAKAQTCNCLGNCATCNTTAGVCTECKPGYKSSDYCLEPCPKGWSGVACNITGSEVEEENKVDETKSKSLLSLLLKLPLAALPLLLCCLCIFLKRRKRENSNADADQPEEVDEEKADEEGKQDDQQDNDDQHNDNGEDNQGGERGSRRESGKEDQHPDGNQHDDGVEDENGDRGAAADNDDV